MSSKTHGLSKTRVYSIWVAMHQRCYNSNCKKYYRYGGRGIAVCKRWKSFIKFYEDMGQPDTDKHTLDRIDNDVHYKKSNCRWATRSEQNLNRKETKWFTYNGITKCMTHWEKEYGLNPGNLHHRLFKMKLSIGEALTFKKDNGRNRIFINKNPKKTHCKHGHKLTEENSYIRPNGRSRECRICKVNLKNKFLKSRIAEGLE